MKAQRLHAFGDVSQFVLDDVDKPGTRPGHVLISVRATSINPADCKSRQNGPAFAPELPAVLGSDVAGVVVGVGDGVDDFAIGDEVFGCAGGLRGLDGAYAEFMNADVRLIAPKPQALSMAEAAALPLVSITAWEGLCDRANLRAGQTVLIHGGAGGVGHVAIQIAKARGGRVFTTVSSDEKAAMAKKLGADETINYRQESVDDYVKRLTDGRGFDIVFDATGEDNYERSFLAASLSGHVVTILSRFTCDLAPMMAKGLSLHVVFMLIPMIHDVGRERHGEILREITRLADEGRMKPLIDDRGFTLETLPKAHRYLESGSAVGNVVVSVS